MSNNFVIFRCAKLKQGNSSKSLNKAWRHLEKHTQSAEISHPELSQQNMTYYSKAVQKSGHHKIIKNAIALHNKNSTKKLRTDAAIGVEMIFSFSPSAVGSFSISDYEKHLMLFIKKEFPTFQILRIDRHMDESSIHWHVLGIPFKDRERVLISAKSMLGGPEEMRQHQTHIANEMESLGLVRGISKKYTKNIHRSKSDWLRDSIVKESHQALKDIGLDDFEL